MFYECEIRTGLNDVGKNSLITNKALLTILETVGGYQSDEAGYGLLDIENKGVSWILMDWRLHVIKRPMYGQKLIVKTWGRNVKKVSTYRDYELYDDNNNLCVIATTKWALVDITRSKITKIGPDVMEKYKIDDKCVFEDSELEKVRIPDIFDSSIKCKVQRRNIDVNGHMHNTHYLELAYEALPEDVYNNRPYNDLRISYKHEIKLGDEVTCNYVFNENKHIVVIKKDDLVCAVCELY